MSALKMPLILVLEQPWWSLADDQFEETVRPYIEGLTRRVGCKSYYSSFFDLGSLRQAMEHLVQATANFPGAPVYLYIASHGAGRRVGSNEIAGRAIYLNSLLKEVGKLAETVQRNGAHLEGILLGSCEVGRSSAIFEKELKGKPFRWIAGYRHSVDWLASTTVDLAILHAALNGDIPSSKGKDAMLAGFQWALKLFNSDYPIDHEIHLRTKKVKVLHTMKQTVVVVGQPSGSGNRPSTWTGEDLWPK